MLCFSVKSNSFKLYNFFCSNFNKIYFKKKLSSIFSHSHDLWSIKSLADGPVRTALEVTFFRVFKILYVLFGLFSNFSNFFWLFHVFLDLFKSFYIFLDLFRSFSIFFKLFWIVFDLFQFVDLFWSYSIFWVLLRSFEIFWDLFEPLRSSETY